MTDWTKKNSEDDEFISWMNKDKKKYESLYPKKIKNHGKTKKIILLGIFISVAIIVLIGIFSSNNEFSSEKYFYIPDYRLNKSPIFCAKDFSDPKFPSANNYVIENTKKQ